MAQQINEKMNLHEQWYEEARKLESFSEFAEFARKLDQDYIHDYGTICHAVAAVAVGAAATFDRTSKQGGITGFQAGMVMWQFIRQWLRKDGPMKLVDYNDMLWPQYEESFTKRTITQATWAQLQAAAAKHLKDREGEDDMPVSGRVVEHQRKIVAGIVPFGYTVVDR